MTTNTPRDCDICGLSTRGGPHYCNTPTPLNRQELREAVANAIDEALTLKLHDGGFIANKMGMADAAIKAYEEFNAK